MYKALVCSHLDCCDIIYHMSDLNSQINLGVTLSLEWRRLGEHNINLPFLLFVHGKVLTSRNLTKNWGGKPYITVVGAGTFFRLTRLKIT